MVDGFGGAMCCVIHTSVISIPMTLPFGPTFCAARKQSKPPPLPRSTTVSPYIQHIVNISQEKGKSRTAVGERERITPQPDSQ